MEKYIISIDQGTTSTRAILFTLDGKIKAISSRSLPCYYPSSNAVEQNPLEIIISVNDTINELMIKEHLLPEQILSLGITNQRETTIVWEKATGRPVFNALVWQSKQSQDICEALKDKEEFIMSKTGLILNPYFSASKIRYILDHIDNGQSRAENGELLFGTVDTWILYKMTKGKVHATDVSNASRTMLYNIYDLKWDEELLSLFNIPMAMLPKVNPSSYIYGEADFFKTNVPIAGIAGDQQSALFGQACFNEGELKNTYGTGCFLLMNTGNKPVLSSKGLLTTIAWQLGDEVTYALEGSVFVAGASVQWLRDQMKMIADASDSERVALKASPDSKVYVVPAFVGLGTPYWDDDARGAVFGLTRATTKYDFVKATLDSIAYQSRDVIEVMKEETKLDLRVLKVDGGATKNGYLMQTQSDILQTDILLPRCLETTALGVAYLAGLAVKFWEDVKSIQNIHKYQKSYYPLADADEVEEKYRYWKIAVNATRSFK